jgi:hypothetical protein
MRAPRLILCTLALYAFSSARAALDFLPLSEVRAGQRGIGKTVFSGDRIEDFQVEILGILANTGPKESIILARLSGGPLDHTGVMQGMSGSPVYIGGRLIGAVALAFPYAKDPIAGIRPIEEMLRVDAMPAPPRPKLVAGGLLPAASDSRSDSRMVEVATPLSLSGFSPKAVEAFAPGLRALGLEPRQGMAVGGAGDLVMGDPSKLKPGSMISVELMTGDMSVGADGTLTCIDGEKIFAFGHRFLSVGPTDLPFTRSEVLTLLANVNTSFKISAAKELMGVISQDRNTAVSGLLGRRAATLPLEISVTQDGTAVGQYRMQVVNDRFLSPYLSQMAIFSAIEATERATGASSIQIRGQIEFEGRPDTVELRNFYAGETSSAMVAATTTALPLSYVMQGGFDALKVKRIVVRLETSNTKKDLAISQLSISRREAKQGETVELTTVLDGQNGVEERRTVRYRIPVGTAPGTLYFTVADGGQTSVADLRQTAALTPHTPEQLIANVNRLRSGDRAYLRVWRAEPAFEAGGEELPDPPPSVSLVLSGSQSLAQNRNSKIAEMVIDAGDRMVTGSKTVQVEVVE